MTKKTCAPSYGNVCQLYVGGDGDDGGAVGDGDGGGAVGDGDEGGQQRQVLNVLLMHHASSSMCCIVIVRLCIVPLDDGCAFSEATTYVNASFVSTLNHQVPMVGFSAQAFLQHI